LQAVAVPAQILNKHNTYRNSDDKNDGGGDDDEFMVLSGHND